MRRRTLYVCALLLIAAIALYFPLAGSTAPRGQSSGAASKKRELPNFDAFASGGKRSSGGASATGVAESPGLQEDASPQMEAGHPVQMEQRLGVPTFLWAVNSGKARTLSARAETRRADAAAAAYEHLGNYGARYRLSGPDIAGISIAGVHDTGRGAIIVKLKQSIGGIEVFRDEMNVIMNRKLQLLAISGYLTGGGSDAVSIDGSGFSLTREQAVARAVGQLSDSAVSPSAVRGTTNAKATPGYSYFTADLGDGARVGDPARVKQVMFHTAEGFVPAYYIEAEVLVPSTDQTLITLDGTTPSESLYYSFVISAVDGQLLFRKNLVQKDGFTYRVWADANGVPYDGPNGPYGPYPTATPSGFVPPFIAPNDVTLQNFPFSKNDPWLAPGATETNGNNVDAFVNLYSPDGFGNPITTTPTDIANGDHRAQITAAGQFLHTHQPDVDAFSASARQASITQLFFNVNFLHDWFYDSGFDEASGNGQKSNYGRGGIENDDIKAQAQDFQSFNNANMLTPADGTRPRMRMYNFPNLSNKLDISAPAAIAGAYNIGISQTGIRNFDVTNDIVRATFTAGPTTCTITNAAALDGKIAMFDFDNTDGTGCGFSTRIARIHATNAAAALMVYTSAAPTIVANITGINSTHTKPIGIISWNTGQVIKPQLAVPETVTARLLRVADRDGALDNQIVAHEWGHYLSNRLIANAGGLNNQQGGSMGEGWGDFVSMLLTVREGDDLKPNNANFSGVYIMGSYASGHHEIPLTYWYGSRRAPYSTDMTKNGYTFRHISDGQTLPVTTPITLNSPPNSEVHNSGEVWATMLWECYAALLNDTGRLTFSEAQQRMRDYLVASLKMTPASPTFTEARDAVLAAAYANDPLDGDLFAQAFAKRGIGVNAVSPDRYSSNHAGVVESYEVGSNLSFVSASFDDNIVSCDNDDYLDNNEKGTLSVTLKNIGGQTLSNTIATVTSSNAGVNFPDGNVINFGPSDPFGTVTGTVAVEGKNLSGMQATDYTITFSDTGSASGLTGTAHHYAKLNVDEAPTSSKNEDFESHAPVWTKGFNATFGNFAPWTLTNVGPDYVFHADNFAAASDQYLISPALNVSATGNFVISFSHRHSFEAPNWDGGRLEITTNGGTNWTPIGTAPTFYNGTLINNSGNPLQNQQAFIGQSAGYPAFTTATLDLGTTYQGQTVQIRFRAASDGAAGAPGWDVASVNFTGIDNTPFTTLVAEAGPCAATVTLELNPATIPGATVNTPYSVLFNASGGTGPYTYDAPSGLPAGLSSAPFGAGYKISGTPTEAGSFPFTINYHDSASHNGSANYTLVVSKSTATITLANLSHVYDGTAKFATAATNPPGLDTVTITYSQNGNPVANPTDAGTYAVLAHLDNPNFAAPDKTSTLSISKATQTIDFGPLAGKVFKDPPFTISATATSGLPVTLKVVSGPAYLSGAGGTTVNLTGAGTVKIRATQAGNNNYKPALAVDQTFTVAKATATISVGSLTQAYTGTARRVTVVTSPVTLAGVKIVYRQSGNPVVPINVGSYDVEVTLTNANYQATPVNTTLVITKAKQGITFPPIASRQFSPTPFNISATATSGLPVTFQVMAGPATISGNSVTMTGTGTVRIRASQAGNSNYNAAPAVDRTFKITP
ncbi:MAG TPA: M36 family metallopeptidase [Pyrinomonadaceae bacterium]|nr:M36 family metallopeptidase [Pyrinomonadaceae bacterium]